MKPGTENMGGCEIPRPVKTTRVVRILDIVEGDPPFIVVFERLHGRGKERSFLQEIKVLDGQLFQQLLAEVRKGEEIEAVIVTEFAERGYTTYLAGFSRRESITAQEEEQ